MGQEVIMVIYVETLSASLMISTKDVEIEYDFYGQVSIKTCQSSAYTYLGSKNVVGQIWMWSIVMFYYVVSLHYLVLLYNNKNYEMNI